MPLVEQYVTIACVTNKVGGDLVGNALWRGVRLRDVLDAPASRRAPPRSSAAPSTASPPASRPLGDVAEREALMALAMNGGRCPPSTATRRA